jgi:hypothetical protein
VPITSDLIAQKRIGEWVLSAHNVTEVSTWTEKRQAIQVGAHTYLVSEGQVFQCAHCGHYDPKWKVQEVLKFFEETMGIKPIEITVTCTFGD